MKRLALKVDVDTYRGTREGVPELARLFEKYGAKGSFYFSLGPDQTGRAIKRAFRPGFMKKVSRTSVLEHYGLKTLLYGTLLPAPHIGKKCASIMREIKERGHEVGIHVYNHIKWQDYVAQKDWEWTKHELDAAADSFKKVFNTDAKTHAAAGWQINNHALKLEEQMHLDYCSDTRGKAPFIPLVEGHELSCPQIPTTLPTIDEILGADGLTPENVHTHLLKLTQSDDDNQIHVYTLHAELEGMKLSSVLEKLLQGWKEQSYQFVSMNDLFHSLDLTSLPRSEVTMSEFEGRSGLLAVPGNPSLRIS